MVTIRDITQRADIAYATFFRHYRDKEALLDDVLDVVLEELVALLQPSAPVAEAAAVGSLLFDYVREHSEVCRVLLQTRGSGHLVRRMIAEGSRRVAEDQRPRAGSTVPPEVAAHHLVASTVALIQWWLEHEMPYPPERMGIIYRDLIYQPTITAAFAQ